MREKLPVIRVRAQEGGVVARDGVVLTFFMRRSHPEVAAAVWRAMQLYLRAIPPQALGWYVNPEGDMSPLDDKGWEHIRQKLLERSGRVAWRAELREDPSETRGYQLEYEGLKLDDALFAQEEGATSAIAFTFPTEDVVEHGPARLRALALEMARELPFSFGYASLAFVSPGADWSSARGELDEPLARYLGMDLYHLRKTSRVIGTRARGAYWLTFLGPPLLGQLGGVEALRDKLSLPGVTFEPMEGERLLVTLGEWPDAIDVTKGPPPAPYRALARLLEPVLYDERSGWGFLSDEGMHRWIRRLSE